MCCVTCVGQEVNLSEHQLGVAEHTPSCIPKVQQYTSSQTRVSVLPPYCLKLVVSIPLQGINEVYRILFTMVHVYLSVCLGAYCIQNNV